MAIVSNYSSLANTCFNDIDSGFKIRNENTRSDLIGLVNLTGVTIGRQHADPESIAFEEKQLDETELQLWLEEQVSAADNGQQWSKTKLLVGEPVTYQDHLQPPPDALAVRSSRTLLCQKLQLPSMGVELISKQRNLSIQFSTAQNVDTFLYSYAIATSGCNLCWSHDPENGVQSGIVIFFNPRLRQTFMDDLKSLQIFEKKISPFPFLMAVQSFRSCTMRLGQVLNRGKRVEAKILRPLSASDFEDLFTEVSLFSNTAAEIHAECKAVLEALSWYEHLGVDQRPRTSPANWLDCNARQKQLDKRIQDLQSSLKQIYEVSRCRKRDDRYRISMMMKLRAQHMHNASVQKVKEQNVILEKQSQNPNIGIEAARSFASPDSACKRPAILLYFSMILVLLVHLGFIIWSFRAASRE